MYSKKLVFWLTLIVYWSLFFVYIIEIVFGYTNVNSVLKPPVLGYSIIYAYFGIPLSLLLKKIFQKYLKSNSGLLRSLYIVLPASIFVSHLYFGYLLIIDKIFEVFLNHKMYPLDIRYYLYEIFTGSMALLTWSAIYLFTEAWYRINEQKLKLEKALLQAKSSQLEVLRYQINPHFLFNSFCSLRALIRSNPSLAEETISKLSEFMRYSLVNREETEIALIDEIKIIEDYLSIEKVRFQDKLETEIHVDQFAEDYPVPIFILLPIVENAIKYGMLTSEVPLELNIVAKVVDDELILSIKNSGNWIENNSEKGVESTGTGLENIKNRLLNSYDEKQSFKIIKHLDEVIIEIRIEHEINKEVYEKD